MTPLQFTFELIGTALLLLLGGGVVANAVLPKNNGQGGGFLMINFGWGIAVMIGALVAGSHSGASLNPALTIAQFADPNITEFGPGIATTFGNMVMLILAQMLGAMLGAFLCWLAYKQQFDEEPEAANKLGVFSTGPQIRSYGWNLTTEIIATFVLVFTLFMLPKTADGLGPVIVALLIVGLGASLGGPTGYALNPARDLGPRIMHALLPIKGKGESDWSYAWVPVVGPIVGALLAALVHGLLV